MNPAELWSLLLGASSMALVLSLFCSWLIAKKETPL